MADPQTGPSLSERLIQMSAVPLAGSTVDLHIGRRTVDDGCEVLARRNLEIQHVTSSVRDMRDRSLGFVVVQILQDAVADDEIVGMGRLPCGNVSLDVTEFRTGVFADIGGCDSNRRMIGAEPIAPQSRSGSDVEDGLGSDAPPGAQSDDSRGEMRDTSAVVNSAASIETLVIPGIELVTSVHRHVNN